jgi:hypothetical protein
MFLIYAEKKCFPRETLDIDLKEKDQDMFLNHAEKQNGYMLLGETLEMDSRKNGQDMFHMQQKNPRNGTQGKMVRICSICNKKTLEMEP